MLSGNFEYFGSVKNSGRLSKEQSNDQATDQSGTVDFYISGRQPLTSSARISRHGVVYGVQEGRIVYRENLSLEVRESQLSLRI
jgi:hypothetical protein